MTRTKNYIDLYVNFLIMVIKGSSPRRFKVVEILRFIVIDPAKDSIERIRLVKCIYLKVEIALNKSLVLSKNMLLRNTARIIFPS